MERPGVENFALITTADFDRICRCCLSTGSLHNIFEYSSNKKTFFDHYKAFCAIEVKPDDNLPQSICEQCVTKLVFMYDFKNKCARSEKLLKELLATIGKAHIKDENHGEEATHNIDIKEENCESEANSSTFMDNIDINENFHIAEIDKFKLENDCDVDVKAESYTCELMVNAELECGKSITSQEVEVPKTAKKRSWLCCQETFTTYLSFIRHYKRMNHQKSDKHQKCPVCDKSFHGHGIRQHMRTHTKEKPYICKFCFKQFSLSGNLSRHIKRHTGERPHVCDVCGKGFIQAHSLVNHKRTHTGEKPFPCPECDKKFVQSKTLQTHLKKHQLKSGRPLECETCRKVFSTKYVLQNHMLRHGKKSFLCSHCGKSFATNGGLSSHFKVHTGVKSYECESCGKRFANLGTLNSHILLHTGEKPFSCEVCSKSFAQKGNLRLHLRMHRGEKRYSCSLCTKSFLLRSALTVHVRMHTGERPYVCDVCSKGFHSSSNLKQHKRRHNTATSNQIVGRLD